MRAATSHAGAAILIALAAACQPAGERRAPAAERPAGNAPALAEGAQAPFAAIAAEDTIRLVGTEPFWGGTIRAGELVYSTPENQRGDLVAVRRFAGNNGLGFSGTWNGAPLDLAITPASCSDGMSDRIYPFAVTLRLGEEQRDGCAWTDRMPFTGAGNP